MSALSQAIWQIKWEKNNKVSLDMAQVVGVLTTVMVFTGLSIRIVVGGLMRETKIPVQELWVKMGEEHMCEGVHMGGILQIQTNVLC